MTQFEDLSRVVSEAIKAGRIGQPVFVRCVATLAPDGDSLATVARLVQAAGDWLGSPVHRLYAADSAAPIQRSVNVEFAGGASALVSTATGGSDGPTIDLIVLGNHGALYHESLASGRTDAAARAGTNRIVADPAIRAAIEASLRSGRPHVLPAKEWP